MLRVGGGFASFNLSAQEQLRQATQDFVTAGLRLATQTRIPRAKDDPAGLVAVEALRRELNERDAQFAAANRAQALTNLADSALSQVNPLLNQIRGNVVTAASSTTSSEERAALQLEIDAALDSLDRIGGTTEILGLNLFNGTTTIRVGAEGTDSLTLPRVSSSAIGTDTQALRELGSGGVASLDSGDLELSLEIVDAAQSDVSTARGAIGAFQRTIVESSAVAAAKGAELTSRTMSLIADTDFANETVSLIRSQFKMKTTLAAIGIGLRSQDQAIGLLFDSNR